MLPHHILEEAVAKFPGDWVSQFNYVTMEANSIIKEQAQTIREQQEKILELTRNNMYQHNVNASLRMVTNSNPA